MKIGLLMKIAGLLFVLTLVGCVAGLWYQKTSGATLRGSHSAVVYNEKMYIFAGEGENDNALDDLWVYDIATDTWTQGTSGPPGRRSHTAVVYNDKMYVFGGRPDNAPHLKDIWEYNFSEETWAQKTSGATPRQGHTAVIYNGKMYVLAGHLDDTKFNDLWEYDIEYDSWAYRGTAGCGYLFYHTTVIYDDKMYVFGGLDENNNMVNGLWVYDIENDSWSKKSDAPFFRAMHSAVVYNDKMYVFGGAFGDSKQNLVFFNDLWEYDFANDSWKEIQSCSPPSQRATHSAVVCNNKMYVFGGLDNELWENIILLFPLH